MIKLPHKTLVCLTLILLAGAAFRFYGLTIGFPFEYHVDEWFIVNRTLDMYRTANFKPPAFDYPSLLYYLLLAGAYVVGLFKETTLYDLYIFGRTLSALSGVATIAVVYLTGKRAYGVRAGLSAAALFACTVTALRESHYCTTDSINTLFITLAVYFIVRVGMGDARRNYLFAGACIGLAAGSKYNGAFLSVPLILAHILRTRGESATTGDYSESPTGVENDARTSRLRAVSGGLFSRWLLAAGLLCVLVFLSTTPYALLTPADFIKDVSKMSNALSRKVVEGNQHYIGTTAYWYYVENLLYWAMGPLPEAVCLLGVLYALARHRRQDLLLACWLLIYFYIVGGWLNKAVRYTLPMLPFLSILGAAMFVESFDYLRRTMRRKLALVVLALGLVTLSSAFLYALAYMNIYAQPHTGIQATRWANANLPVGARILLEGPTPHERPQVDGSLLIYQDPSFNFNARRFDFQYLDVSKFSRTDADENILRAELQQLLARADYIIMTTRWSEGLRHSPQASPVIREYYQTLLEGRSDFALVKQITVYPRLLGFDINDDAAELNFRIFDHPKVLIFQRQKPPTVSVSDKHSR
ncbi:MAG TPA: glycosyltransferase family 39 protein [Pyrinomonadaceae bacterium]|jgi:4-amino-4-deoxy-L-arabinose transferase-like glycosyltransferase|nr:glycosyltransferase family 39 protein [Pyrinomonadaceae bacterium]